MRFKFSFLILSLLISATNSTLIKSLGFDFKTPNAAEAFEWTSENVLCPSCEAAHWIGFYWIKSYMLVYGATDDPVMDQM